MGSTYEIRQLQERVERLEREKDALEKKLDVLTTEVGYLHRLATQLAAQVGNP